MGVSVSALSPPPVDEQATTGLHGYAMGDDVAAMSAFLNASQDLDIDARDEYVSIWLFAVRWCLLCGPLNLQGYTALHLAADRGNVAAVELLLSHGADKSLKVSTLPNRFRYS